METNVNRISATGQSAIKAPDPEMVLLLIQFVGGAFSLLAIVTLMPPLATFDPYVFPILLGGAALNVVGSLALLYGYASKRPFYARITDRFKPISPKTNLPDTIGLIRAALWYDMLLLGILVTFTGGPEESLFALQFAALLPIAMLVPDTPFMKAVHAVVFIIMFFFGLVLFEHVHFAYQSDAHKPPSHQLWFVTFFLIFTCGPTFYSISAEHMQAHTGSSH
ncbi:MAG: hypothetical protein JWM95_1171 [Gemmatimonadetes bacterium]|nr:hypothetical protein [Gemmatimonadota bacterium]